VLRVESAMLGFVIALAGQATIAASSASPGAQAPFNPNANVLFDRDTALKSWAVRLFDSNHDGWLTLYEAQPALLAFKDLADGDRDGRVTTYEYDRAKEFIAARR
jgi:hypothetical protein